LQRLITSHDAVSSTSEPWILLPFLYPLKEHGIYAEYSHSVMHRALQGFLKNLPSEKEDYLTAVRGAALTLYKKAADNSSIYFLDKTPRYHLICEDIIETFPDGKFIFLWRNPLSIISSIIETWGKGRWNLFNYKIDLYDGINNLTNTYRKYEEKSLAINYEDFITDMDSELKRVFTYLELELQTDIKKKYIDVVLRGEMGDDTGKRSYSHISEKPIEKWKGILCNPFRKFWCKKYINWLGSSRLESMGYVKRKLLEDLEEVEANFNSFSGDLVLAAGGVIYCLFDPNILMRKLKMIKKFRMVKRYK